METRTKALKILKRVEIECSHSEPTKMLAAVSLFDFIEILTEKKYPKNWLEIFDLFSIDLIKSCSFIDDKLRPNASPTNKELDDDIEHKTGEVYYKLWRRFQNKEYFERTADMLKARLEKNGISVGSFKRGLDSGCGSGRYTFALNQAGVVDMTGIDISQNSLDFARKMIGVNDGIKFEQGSVLDLPFDDNSFDFAFSNGVLHHTTSAQKGLSEIKRVLTTGGGFWLYLYGGKDCFFWDMVDTCRQLLAGIPQDQTIQFMNALGYNPGRIFHRNDFFYVPIHNRYFDAEVRQMLTDVGFKNVTRLKKGFEHDWDEIILNNPHIDPYIYGEGELRFWVS